MKDKILKLASSIKDEYPSAYEKLLKMSYDMPSQRNYLLIDVQEMESMVDPDKVEEYKGIGKVELEV